MDSRKKLTIEKANEIRERYISPNAPTRAALAEEYGISKRMVDKVLANQIYVDFSKFKEDNYV